MASNSKSTNLGGANIYVQRCVLTAWFNENSTSTANNTSNITCRASLYTPSAAWNNGSGRNDNLFTGTTTVKITTALLQRGQVQPLMLGKQSQPKARLTSHTKMTARCLGMHTQLGHVMVETQIMHQQAAVWQPIGRAWQLLHVLRNRQSTPTQTTAQISILATRLQFI